MNEEQSNKIVAWVIIVIALSAITLVLLKHDTYQGNISSNTASDQEDEIEQDAPETDSTVAPSPQIPENETNETSTPQP